MQDHARRLQRAVRLTSATNLRRRPERHTGKGPTSLVGARCSALPLLEPGVCCVPDAALGSSSLIAQRPMSSAKSVGKFNRLPRHFSAKM